MELRVGFFSISNFYVSFREDILNNTSKWWGWGRKIYIHSDSARGAVTLATLVVGEVISLKSKTNV